MTTEVEEVGAWKLLCMSVLHEAINLMHKKKGVSVRFASRELSDAEHWVENGETGLVTFNECCDMLGMPPEIVREKIKAHIKKPVRKPAFKRNEKVYAAYKEWQEGQAQEAEACAAAN